SVAAISPQVVLQPATAQALALALHELATNAAKYGALSTAAGTVRLAWELEPATLVLQWTETGGPSVEPPCSEGYGTRVIGASIERQLGGRASFDWRPEGLHCVLSLPRVGEKGPALRIAGGGVPFVFVTGYGAESIDGRFAHVPILQKPIERQVLQHLFVAPGNGSLKLAWTKPEPPEPLYPPAAALAGSRPGVGTA